MHSSLFTFEVTIK